MVEVTFYWRPHTWPSSTQFRWWRQGDPGDCFDVIDKGTLDKRIAACETLGIPCWEETLGIPCWEDDDDCPCWEDDDDCPCWEDDDD